MEKLILLPTWLSNSTLLLDTNFFIKYEFIRSKTIDVVREKEKYFHRIIDTVLPYDAKIDELVVSTIEEYKQYMDRLSLADLVLATYLKRYRGLFLLTRDHADFPTTVFTREHIFNIESFRERIYAIYSYKPKVQELEEEIPF